MAFPITQRGVDRQPVFFSPRDRETYRGLVAENPEETHTRILAYCLLTNHVHWIAIPEREDSLAVLFRRVHGRYAQYVNAKRRRAGHLWQNRYYSCALSPGNLPGILDETFWRETGGAAAWKERLDVVLEEREASGLRRCTHSGKPFGEAEFVEAMEQRFDRHWRRPGRPGRSKPAFSKPGTEPSDPVRVLENCASSG